MKKQLNVLIEAIKKVDPNIVTEEFTSSIEQLFESAVDAKVSTLREEIENELRDQVSTDLQDYKEELIEKLDKYLDISVQEFTESFEPEIEDTVKSVTFQNLFEGIIKQFERYNINVPQNDMNMVERLKEKVENLEEQTNSLMNEKMNLEEETLKQKCLRIFEQRTSELTETEKEKMKFMMNDVQFDDEYIFEQKLDTMMDNFLTEDEDSISVNDNTTYLNEEVIITKNRNDLSDDEEIKRHKNLANAYLQNK